MSNHAIKWAWRANVTPAGRKLVLVFLADSLNEETRQLNPSVTTIARACGISPRQAQRHLQDLEQQGLLRVIANKFGGNPGESKRYLLTLPEVAETHDLGVTPVMDVAPVMDDVTGDTHDTEGVTPMTQRGDTDVTQTRRNQKTNQNGTRSNARTVAAAIECPSDVDQKVWADFLAIRKAKRAPMTQTALDGIQREAIKVGLTLQQALIRCIEWSWQGFDAEWYAKRTSGTGSTLNKQVALEQRNRAVAAEWLASQGVADAAS